MKLKNFLLTGLSFVLVAAVSIGGTLAYLTSTDDNVNVMTLGNVSIAQHEYERVVNADGTYATATIDNQTSYILEEFKQAKPLLPIVGDPSLPGDNPEYAGYDNTVIRMSQVDSYGSAWVFAGKNAQDKLVTIENTGKSDAYIRTLIAYECGSVNSVSDFNKLVSTSEFKTDPGEVWTKSTVGIVNINGNNYVVIEFIYNGGKHLGGVHENGILPAGETSYPSLCQVYMKSSVTNEDCEALDGNANGTYDILVLTQAVQTAGFDSAEAALTEGFGAITSANVTTWFEEMLIARNTITASTPEEVLEAFENAQPGMTINAEGVTIDINDVGTDLPTGKRAIDIPGDVTVQNLTVIGSYRGGNTLYFQGTADQEIVFENCTFALSGRSMGFDFMGAEGGVNSVVYNSCSFKGAIVLEFLSSKDGVATYNNCTFTKHPGGGSSYVMANGGTHLFNGCTFDYTGLTQSNMGIINTCSVNATSESDGSNSTVVILDGCTRINCGTRKYGADSTLTIK